jgi:hydrogenase nickel incorporation protein HypB
VKYPTLFVRAGLLVITKTDLLPHVTFSVERVRADCAKLNSAMRVITTSVKAGEGIPELEAALLSAGTPSQ